MSRDMSGKAIGLHFNELPKTNRTLFLIEIPEVNFIFFECGFCPGIPQAEMVIMVGWGTIGQYLTFQRT